MSLIIYPECENKVSSSVKECSKCGFNVKGHMGYQGTVGIFKLVGF
jgi:hypothetical protein